MTDLVLVNVETEPTDLHILKIQGKLKWCSVKNKKPLNSYLLYVTGPYSEQFLRLIKTHHLNFSTRGKAPFLIKINVIS